jgi:hypothetical protein
LNWKKYQDTKHAATREIAYIQWNETEPARASGKQADLVRLFDIMAIATRGVESPYPSMRPVRI